MQKRRAKSPKSPSPVHRHSSTVKRSSCPLCAASDPNVLYSCIFGDPPLKDFLDHYYSRNFIDFSFLKDTPFVIGECRSCGFIYQENILSDRFMATFYGDWLTLPGETDSRQSAEYYEMHSNEVAKVARYFIGMSRLKVLDFGAGWGEWGSMAKAYGADVYAVELSAEKDRYMSLQGIHTLTERSLGQPTFDFINTEQVFEHISDPAETLKVLSASLKRGGVIKISVPNGSRVRQNLIRPDWFADRFGPKSLMPIHPLEHINCYTSSVIDEMASRNGLKRISLGGPADMRSIAGMTIKDLLRPAYNLVLQRFEIIVRNYYQKTS